MQGPILQIHCRAYEGARGESQGLVEGGQTLVRFQLKLGERF